MMARDPCIVFLHVPKTGGSTLRATLRFKYPDETLALPAPRVVGPVTEPHDPFESIAAAPVEQRARARVVTGHIHYGVHAYVPQECRYVTVLRQPVARVMSHYYRILTHSPHWFHDELVRSEMDLEQFVRSPVAPVDNLQTRLMSGRGWGLAPDGPHGAREPVGEKDLATAKANLERVGAIGLTERFDESFILIRRALGWRLPMYRTHHVTKGSRPEPPREALEAIRERERLDLELYEHARMLFSRAIEAQGRSLRRELAAFRLLNRVPNKVGPRIPAPLRQPLRAVLPR